MSEDLSKGIPDQEVSKDNIAAWPIEKEMRALVASGLHLNQDAVYQRLSAALPMEEVVDKVKDDFGGETSERMMAEVREKLGEEYVCLLIEPSVSTRFDDFVAFAAGAVTQEGLHPWDVRNRFKDSLGKKRVYRVSTATPADLENISFNGFVANYYRKRQPQALLQNTDGYESMEYALTDLRGRVNFHAGSFAHTENSMFISVSEYPDMAQYAATVQLKDKLPEMQASGNKLYLFPIEMDEFYLIRYGKKLEKTIKGDGVWTDGKTEISYDNPGIEALVEFRIPPQAIKKDQVKELNPKNVPQFRFVPKAK